MTSIRSFYPEILHQAAEYAGVDVKDVHDAIQTVLSLVEPIESGTTRHQQILEIYDTWLKSIATPLVESTGMSIDTVYGALIGAVQWTKEF